jgi:hypothetical protein
MTDLLLLLLTAAAVYKYSLLMEKFKADRCYLKQVLDRHESVSVGLKAKAATLWGLNALKGKV